MRSLFILAAVPAAVVAAVVAAGCAHTRSGPEQAQPKIDPPCALAGTKAKTCVVRGNKTVCHVYVGEIDGLTHVYPDILSVPADAGKLVVIWHLQVPGAKFIKRGDQEDGPKWKASGSAGEFEDGEPTEDVDGAQQSRAEGRRYRITFKNRVMATHPYVIQYRKGNQIQRCDPQIISEAG